MGKRLMTVVAVGRAQSFLHNGQRYDFGALGAGPQNDASTYVEILGPSVGSGARVLTEPQATTPVRIVSAVKDMVRRAEPGDVAILVLSGHGARVHDANGDEDANAIYGNQDEAFVAEGGFLLDDHLTEAWSGLERKPGVLAFAVVDCCDADDLGLGDYRSLGYFAVQRREVFRPSPPDFRCRQDHGPSRLSISATPFGDAYQVEVQPGRLAGLLTASLGQAWMEQPPTSSYREWFARTSYLVEREAWTRGLRQQPRLIYRGPDPDVVDRPRLSA